MKLSKTFFRVGAMAALVLILYSTATAQQLTLTGQILTSTFLKNAPRRFNIKLYPPKASGEAIQVTTSDAYGRFKFEGLSAGSYLLEVYLGKDLVFQDVITLSKNTDRKIDLRKK
jgi:hypothetical protein